MYKEIFKHYKVKPYLIHKLTDIPRSNVSYILKHNTRKYLKEMYTLSLSLLILDKEYGYNDYSDYKDNIEKMYNLTKKYNMYIHLTEEQLKDFILQSKSKLW